LKNIRTEAKCKEILSHLSQVGGYQGMIQSKCGQSYTKRGFMADSSIWWLLTGVAVAIELMTGTFYLLMFAVGLAAAAIAAHMGMSVTAQLVVASVIGGGAVVAWHFLRGKKMIGKNAEFNSDVNMDIGQTVQVDVWQADGTSSIKYRGSPWTVQLQSGSASSAGSYTVEQVIGSRLIVKKI
jgi:membrane protein implicated in regulation of membrane protease activity